jgi:hypothetical protein
MQIHVEKYIKAFTDLLRLVVALFPEPAGLAEKGDSR